MQVDRLLEALEHGDRFTILEDGEEVTVLRPPTHLTIKAAKVIRHLLGLVDKTVKDNAVLFKLLTPVEQKDFEND